MADDDTANTEEDTSVLIDVLAGDTDPDNDTLTVTNVTDPANGTAVIENNKVRYTPDKNLYGTDTFNYTVSDGNGGTDTATVKVTVDPVIDPLPSGDAECTITGTNGDDVIPGSPGNDVICGLGGNDEIDGGQGNDVIKGNTGATTSRSTAARVKTW